MQRRDLLERAAAVAALSAMPFGAALAAEAKDKKEPPFPVKGKVTVVDFGAPWCASCPEMEELMKKMQKEYGDRAAFITINIDEWGGIENEWLIEELPSQLFFDRTGEPIWQHKGSIEADKLRERVDILLKH